MGRFIGYRIINTSDGEKKEAIGQYDSEDTAIEELTKYARNNIGWMSSDETEICRESLRLRGWYCVGCSSVIVGYDSKE